MKKIMFSKNAFYYFVTVPAVSNLLEKCLAGKVFSSGEAWKIDNSQRKLHLMKIGHYV